MDTQESLIDYLYSRLTGDSSLKTLMGGEVRLALVWAPPDYEFPYLVHRIDISSQSFFPMRSATYYLDIWSYSAVANEIWGIRKRIIELLDKLEFTPTTGEVKSCRVNLQTDGFIPEIEQNIWHYATMWNLRYYRASEVEGILGRTT